MGSRFSWTLWCLISSVKQQNFLFAYGYAMKRSDKGRSDKQFAWKMLIFATTISPTLDLNLENKNNRKKYRFATVCVLNENNHMLKSQINPLNWLAYDAGAQRNVF